MKRMMMAIVTLAMSWCVMANTWTDPKTGIKWTYTVDGGTASVGGGDFESPAVPTSTTGAITVPSTLGGCPVTSIGDWAFESCSGLTSVAIPSSVTSIGESVFEDCCGLTSVTIPSSVTSIGDGAFAGSGLTSVTIPSSVTSIGDGAFYFCEGLTSVTIPSSVTSIGVDVFFGCIGLKSVTIPSSVTSIGDSAFASSGLTSVTIPSSVTCIGDYAFSECSGLTSMTIPSSVTSIGDGAFLECSGLTSITIPPSVTSIGESVFEDCCGLTSVTIPSSVASIGENAFYRCFFLATVCVDKGDVDRVKNLLKTCGFDCTYVTFVELSSDPIPDLGENPTQKQVEEALEGSADGKLAQCITNAASYNAYRDWAEKIGPQAVKDSSNAWVSFALGSDKLLDKPPTDEDLTVEKFEPTSEAGKFDFTVSVDGVEVGSDAQKENLKQVFGLEGAATLAPDDFTSDNIDLTFGTPTDGKVKFTAGPKDAKAATFFMKVKVK